VTAATLSRRAGVGVRLPAALVAGALFAGLFAGQLGTAGRPFVVVGLAAIFVPVMIWVRPAAAPPLLVAAAILVDQFPTLPGPKSLALTEKIPLFHGMGGYRPSDLLLIFTLIVYGRKRGTAEVAARPRTPLARAVGWYTVAVVFALLYGVGTGGLPNVALTEARPFLYLATTYLVVSTFVTTRRTIDAVLWAFVVAEIVRAIQTVLLFVSVRHTFPRPEAILGHEESFFFGLYALLTVGLHLYGIEGRLRTTATWFLPIVIAADLSNGRRTAWLILPVGLLVVMVVGMVARPERRRFLRRFTIGLALVSVVYFPAYWNKTGGLAQPARAFHSAVSPDPRDASSNLYRVQEDANLKYNIKLAGPIGRGFGHRIDYALPIVDISDIDPYIAYIPHNGVWWVFLRLGVPGAVAFWVLLGIAAVTACGLARSVERRLGLIGMLGACAVPAYALLGYNDQGFFYFRVAFVMGALLGLVEAARRLEAEAAEETA
jgi:hypothetical protein